VLVRVNP